MTELSTKPFPELLDSIFNDEILSVPLLYRLSDLSGENLAMFESLWPGVSDDRRYEIARHLADISEDNFVVDFQAVFVCCQKDVDPRVRIAGLDGVWDSTTTALVAPILQMVKSDPSEEVRVAAAAALAHYVLLAEWGQLPRTVSEPIVEALLAEYEKVETGNAVKRAALEALGVAHHPRVASLIEDAYESDDHEMQLAAVFAMGGSADSQWLPILIEEMSSYDSEMRLEAVGAAGALNDKSLVPEIANLLVDEDNAVAMAAVGALGQIGGEEAAAILMRISEDPEYEEMWEAIDDALEEVEWISGNFDVLSLDDEFGDN